MEFELFCPVCKIEVPCVTGMHVCKDGLFWHLNENHEWEIWSKGNRHEPNKDRYL